MTAQILFLSYLERLVPRPKASSDLSMSPRMQIKRIIVIAKLPNATFDYYFAGRLEATRSPPHIVVDMRETLSPDVADGAFVVICRYISPHLLNWLEVNRARLAGVATFIDDDIAAIITGREASLGYRARLLINAVLPLRRLNRLTDFVWVSTEPLAGRISSPNIRILPPAPTPRLWTNISIGEPLDNGRILLAYHATDIHIEEHRFIRPVIERVLAARPNVYFEVFAGRKAGYIWEGLERTNVLAPVGWNEYLEQTAKRKVDIMLVPVLRSRINESRSSTKRIDIARLKAAGIFSEGKAYTSVRHADEIIIPNDTDLWYQKTIEMIDNSRLRRNAANATLEVVANMSRSANDGFNWSMLANRQ